MSEEVWDAVQGRLSENRARQGGNPRRMRMLSGRVYCPHCGAKAVINGAMCRGKRYDYYICGRYQVAAGQLGVRECVGDVYPIAAMEQDAVEALLEAVQKPEAITAAIAAYRQALPDGAGDVERLRRELAGLDAALKELAGEEAAAVQAQIAGLMAGASAGAYSAVFAGISARRKDMQDRRAVLVQTLDRGHGAKPRERGEQEADMRLTVLVDVHEALTSAELEGVEKRNLIGQVVDRVICHKEGAEVVFAPGVFGTDVSDTLQTSFMASSKRVGQRSIRPLRCSAMWPNLGCDRQ